jgi:hypothetical protein
MCQVGTYVTNYSVSMHALELGVSLGYVSLAKIRPPLLVPQLHIVKSIRTKITRHTGPN